MKQNRDGVENSKRDAHRKNICRTTKFYASVHLMGGILSLFLDASFCGLGWLCLLTQSCFAVLLPLSVQVCLLACLTSLSTLQVLQQLWLHPWLLWEKYYKKTSRYPFFAYKKAFLAFYPSLLGTEYLSSTGDR